MEELAQVVARAQGGDEGAYETLVARFQDMAYGYAYALLGDFQMAQDAAQEAFIEAYRCLPDLREPRAFPGWFKRIVFKRCDRLTRRQRSAPVPNETLDRRPAPTPDPAREAEAHDLRHMVLEAVRRLPDREREVTALYYINGYSQREIAAFLDVPTTTVKNRLYTSRKRLKERMIDMVRDTLQGAALPENFSQETLERAVAQAAQWNQEKEYAQAEDLLREILLKVPDHPAALIELNRALMRGRIYGSPGGAWELLPEMAAHARAAIASGKTDPFTRRELARTLLAIPAMGEAVTYLEEWIAADGPEVERVGMLAWALGCTAAYDRAEETWARAAALARESGPAEGGWKEGEEPLSLACYALVDSFAAAGEGDRAARAARSGWQVGRRQAVPDANRWLQLAHRAGLDLDPLQEALLGRVEVQGLEGEAQALLIRAWTMDPEDLVDASLDWARRCVEAGQAALTRAVRPLYGILRDRRAAHAHARRNRAMWALLRDAPGADPWWQGSRIYDVFAYVHAGMPDEAAALAREHYEEEGLPAAGNDMIIAAAAQSAPSPPEVVEALREGGIEAVDEYGLFGWYLTARVALDEGREAGALEALRRALGYWSNPPLGVFATLWQGDRAWDPLRDDPRYRQIWADKRARIGPVYGELHYFPGW